MGASCCGSREKLDEGDRLGLCFGDKAKEEVAAEARQEQKEAEEVRSLQLVVRRTFLNFEVVEPEPRAQRRSLSEPPLRNACEKGFDEGQEEVAVVPDCACMQAGKMSHPADNPYEPPHCIWEPQVPSKPEPAAFQLQRAVHFLEGPVRWELYAPGAGKGIGEISWTYFAW
ncbi:unnamed protein product [Symbiodinium sp. CCMP2592]|nr:unnamed protein product [Symbiodinium sp. CCMP2592]